MRPTRFPLAQRGQALTEFLVLAVALVPLFLLMPLIAKLQDIAHSTQLAARYVAFDALTRQGGVAGLKPEGELADELRRRFFGSSEAPIKTHDVAGEFDTHRNAFWRQPDGSAWVRSFQDVSLGFGAGWGERHEQGFTGASDARPFPLRSRFDLPARGIYTARVGVRLADLPAGLRAYEPFDRLGLAIERHTSVALDGWSGRGPADVQSRLDDLTVFPGRALRATAPLVDLVVEAAESPGGLKAPRLGELDFWQDVVPADRLSQP